MAAIVHFSSIAQAQTIFHVDSAAPGPVHDGTSWCTAFRELQDALDLARGSDEVRIAAGRYRPDRGTLDPREEFRLLDAISLRGGYAGCQSTTPGARDPRLYEVILTGDLNGNDGSDPASTAENSFHVLRTSGTGVTATLDGLTISGGNAQGDTTAQTRGGGLQATNDSRVSVFDCRFVGNQALDDGGAVHVDGGAPVFTNCLFLMNRAGDDGGAIRLGSANAIISNCEFQENEAQGGGGGLYAPDSTISINTSRFNKNISHADGGAISVVSQRLAIQGSSFVENSADGMGGAIWLEAGNLELTDCILTANKALRGGGVAATSADSAFVRTFFDQNEAGFGGALSLELSRGTMSECTFSQNSVVDSGGALSIVQCDMTWNRILLNDNTALRDGGAAVLDNSTIQMTKAQFRGNVANDDGGAFTASTSTVAIFSSQFLANKANDNGGAVRLDNSGIQGVNTAFIGNKSNARGGAIEGTAGSLGLSNCTLTTNAADEVGGIAWVDGEIKIENSILWNNQDTAGISLDAQLGDVDLLTVRQSCVSGWGSRGGDGVIDTDPKFIASPGRDQQPGTGDDNARLGPGSSCLNAGDNALLPPDTTDLDHDGDTNEALPLDADDRFRVIGPAVDLGAWEFVCLDDRGCDDSRFCTGIERCVSGACVSGDPPCGSRSCSEELDQCVQCVTDQNCSDGLFCNGVERCVDNHCESPATPCTGRLCDEAQDECVNCRANSDCDDDDQCTTDRCMNGTCQHVDDSGCADADADGVVDASDRCSDTPPDADVDEDGCSCSQIDDDEDGAANCNDVCPNTAQPLEPGTMIGFDGCIHDIVDSDEDGIADGQDSCPDSRAGAVVDFSGCSDSDDPEGSMIPHDGTSGILPNLCGATGSVFMFLAIGMLLVTLVQRKRIRPFASNISHYRTSGL